MLTLRFNLITFAKISSHWDLKPQLFITENGMCQSLVFGQKLDFQHSLALLDDTYFPAQKSYFYICISQKIVPSFQKVCKPMLRCQVTLQYLR